MHLCENAEHCFERGDKALFTLRDLGQRVREVLRRHLDEHIERVGVVDAVDHDLIVGCVALFEQHRLDLRREDVYALDDQHIVAAAHGFAHLDMCPTARTLLVPKNADIACPVAQQRESLLRNRGEHQFTLRSFRKHFAAHTADGREVDDQVTPQLRDLVQKLEASSGSAKLCGLILRDGDLTLALNTRYVFAGVPEELDLRDIDGIRKWFTASLKSMGQLIDRIYASPAVQQGAGETR